MKYVKLTAIKDKKAIYVNLENTITIRDIVGGARIAFLGGEKVFIDVVEKADDIVRR